MYKIITPTDKEIQQVKKEYPELPSTNVVFKWFALLTRYSYELETFAFVLGFEEETRHDQIVKVVQFVLEEYQL